MDSNQKYLKKIFKGFMNVMHLCLCEINPNNNIRIVDKEVV